MRILVAGDFHADHLLEFRKRVLDFEPDMYISLGDFDTIYTIKAAKTLEDELRSRGVEVVGVPGNHDHGIYHYDAENPLVSTYLLKLGISTEIIHSQLMQDKVAKGYIEKLLRKQYKTLRLGEFDTIVVHGGLAGNLGAYSSGNGDARYLWYRQQDDDESWNNQMAMITRGFNLMIKGHEHFPLVSFFEGRKYRFINGDGPIELDPRRAQVIQPGAVALNSYATIEDKILRLRKIV